MIHRFAPTIALSMGLLPLSLFANSIQATPEESELAGVAAPNCPAPALANGQRGRARLVTEEWKPQRGGLCTAGHRYSLASLNPVARRG